mmetsp:Transcript_8767/g.13101  ORF Transcript_8767/g.13101 Transcript_8767/m.13101 type:complete len:1165 (+) Transcript_8767:149-3643(+)|eukprot:CAMPEP_0185029772 /NCGR_PEP_ID=MMETSP1103-20130426/16272_1 /TAXON_ID=36769 /ORGANISM="Paraphysomonas bandaiensis, Strain Caron Lab Isolate" /LENGTH=1164 /DNA_ID=CAMNT_0027564637 /DNA_START=53 /DNA_END=3550 /DNA_ORIENTATION=+
MCDDGDIAEIESSNELQDYEYFQEKFDDFDDGIAAEVEEDVKLKKKDIPIDKTIAKTVEENIDKTSLVNQSATGKEKTSEIDDNFLDFFTEGEGAPQDTFADVLKSNGKIVPDAGSDIFPLPASPPVKSQVDDKAHLPGIGRKPPSKGKVRGKKAASDNHLKRGDEKMPRLNLQRIKPKAERRDNPPNDEGSIDSHRKPRRRKVNLKKRREDELAKAKEKHRKILKAQEDMLLDEITERRQPKLPKPTEKMQFMTKYDSKSGLFGVDIEAERQSKLENYEIRRLMKKNAELAEVERARQRLKRHKYDIGGGVVVDMSQETVSIAGRDLFHIETPRRALLTTLSERRDDDSAREEKIKERSLTADDSSKTKPNNMSPIRGNGYAARKLKPVVKSARGDSQPTAEPLDEVLTPAPPKPKKKKKKVVIDETVAKDEETHDGISDQVDAIKEPGKSKIVIDIPDYLNDTPMKPVAGRKGTPPPKKRRDLTQPTKASLNGRANQPTKPVRPNPQPNKPRVSRPGPSKQNGTNITPSAPKSQPRTTVSKKQSEVAVHKDDKVPTNHSNEVSSIKHKLSKRNTRSTTEDTSQKSVNARNASKAANDLIQGVKEKMEKDSDSPKQPIKSRKTEASTANMAPKDSAVSTECRTESASVEAIPTEVMSKPKGDDDYGDDFDEDSVVDDVVDSLPVPTEIQNSPGGASPPPENHASTNQGRKGPSTDVDVDVLGMAGDNKESMSTRVDSLSFEDSRKASAMNPPTTSPNEESVKSFEPTSPLGNRSESFQRRALKDNTPVSSKTPISPESSDQIVPPSVENVPLEKTDSESHEPVVTVDSTVNGLNTNNQQLLNPDNGLVSSKDHVSSPPVSISKMNESVDEVNYLDESFVSDVEADEGPSITPSSEVVTGDGPSSARVTNVEATAHGVAHTAVEDVVNNTADLVNVTTSTHDKEVHDRPEPNHIGEYIADPVHSSLPVVDCSTHLSEVGNTAEVDVSDPTDKPVASVNNNDAMGLAGSVEIKDEQEISYGDDYEFESYEFEDTEKPVRENNNMGDCDNGVAHEQKQSLGSSPISKEPTTQPPMVSDPVDDDGDIYDFEDVEDEGNMDLAQGSVLLTNASVPKGDATADSEETLKAVGNSQVDTSTDAVLELLDEIGETAFDDDNDDYADDYDFD